MFLGHWCRLGGERGLAGGEVRDAAEERAALVLGVGVEVVALHDALAVSRLQCGVTDAPVKGDVVARKPRDTCKIIWDVLSRLRLKHWWNLPV